MKTFFRNIVPVFLLLSVATGSALAQSRMATIDLRKVFDNYWRTKQADIALKDRAADMDKDYKGLVDDWKKSKDEYQKLLTAANDQAVSPEEREKRRKSAETKSLEIKESEQSLEGYRRQATATLDEQKRRMRDKILGQIREVVNAKAKAGGYTLVLDTAAESTTSTAVVIYSNGENDLTDSILIQLNADAPPVDTTKPAEKKDDKKKEEKK